MSADTAKARSSRRHVDCVGAADSLPALAAGDPGVAGRVRAHVESCLRCQAELVHYRRLRRNLLAMRAVPVDPDPALLGQILAGIDDCSLAPGDPHMVLRTVAYVGGISVATAAGAAGVLVWMSRRRMSLAG